MSHKQNDNFFEAKKEAEEEKDNLILSPQQTIDMLGRNEEAQEMLQEMEDDNNEDSSDANYPIGSNVELYDIWRENL